MGKTKTMIVSGETETKKSGKEEYLEKMKKKAAAAETSADQVKEVKEKQVGEKPERAQDKQSQKAKVKHVGLKGGERIKVIGAEPEETEAILEPSREESTPKETESKEKQPKIRSKNYKNAKAKVDKNKNYKVLDAITLLKDISYSKFDETLELHIVIKTKGTSVNISLPHSGGKEKKIEVADDTTIEKLKSGKVDFDMLLATADMMPKLVPFARILGPRGLMPNPKNGTLIKSKKDAEKFSGNTLTLKTEKDAPVIHTAVGKLSQKDNELNDNVKEVLDILKKQIVKAYIKSSMSPSIKLLV